jgi:hypothetical protein
MQTPDRRAIETREKLPTKVKSMIAGAMIVPLERSRPDLLT